MAERFGLTNTRRIVVFLGLAGCLTGFSWFLLAQDTSPPGYRAYRLRYSEPAEIIPQLQEMLSELGSQPEILSNPGGNQILVRGSEDAQRLAVELMKTLDRPATRQTSPQTPQTPAVARGYRVGAASLDTAMSKLREKFPPSTGVRVAADERTGQLIIVAPESTHRQITALFGPSSEQPNGPSPKPTNGTARRLEHISWRELEDGLAQIWGNRLSRSTDRNGELARITIATRSGDQPALQIDRRQNIVRFLGPASFSKSWEQVVGSLDRPGEPIERQTELVAIDRADPAKVHRAVWLIQAASEEEERATAGAATQNGGRANQMMTAIFQPNAEEPTPAGAVQPPKPDTKPPVAKPNGDAGAEAAAVGEAPVDEMAEDGGVIGPVTIEYIEGMDALLIRGHKRDVQRVREIIAAIEESSKETQPIVEIYKLNFVGSQVMSSLVSETYDEILLPRQGPVSIQPLVKPNALLLIGQKDSVLTVKRLIAKLDQPVQPETQFEVFQLKHVSAVDAEEAIGEFFVDGLGSAQQAGQAQGDLRPGLGTRVNVIANYRSNSLIVQASPRDMAEVRRLIGEIDNDKIAAVNEVKIFRLKNALASDVAPVLQDALNWQLIGNRNPYGTSQIGGLGGQGFGGQTTDERARLRSAILTFMTIDSDGGKVLESGGPLSDVRVSADMNSNALVVTGPSKSMRLIEALVKELDTLPSARAQIKVFTIINGDATALSNMLQQLLAEQAQTTQQGGTLFGQGAINPFLQPGLQTSASVGDSTLVPIRFGVDQRTNSIVVTGSEGDLGVVEAVLLRLDEDSYREHKTAVYWLANAPAADVADSLNTWLEERTQLFADQLQISPESPDIQWNRQVIVVPEEISNSIIISAAPELFDEVKHVVESLDRRLPLIKIDVLIAEVALVDTFEFGAEFGLQDSLLFDRTYLGNNAGATGNTQPGFNFNNQQLGDIGGNRNQLGAQALSAFGLGRVSSDEGYGGLVLSASRDSVSVLIRALQEDGRVQILARPHITTLDSQPASVFVGETTARPGDISQTANSTNQGIVETDVGLQLDVTPRVTPDGSVVMQVDAQKSRLDTARSVNINGNDISNIAQISASTTISVGSGQTVVFAGLITSEKQTEIRGFPFVSRLPVVGPLLSYTQDSEIRTELLIILTPHVIRHEGDVDWIRHAESERMSWCLGDVLELHGDVGLSARPGCWCREDCHCVAPTPVIFPDTNPTGVEPIMSPELIEEVDPMLPSPFQPSSRRTHQTDEGTGSQAAAGPAPTPSVAPAHYRQQPHQPKHAGARAVYEPNIEPGHQANPNGPREQPGPARGGSGLAIQYERTPNEYQSPKRMPKVQ